MRFTVSALLLASVFFSAHCYFIDQFLFPTCSWVGGQCLSFSLEQASWQDAKRGCKRWNGRLSSLENPRAFMDFVNTYHAGETFWLGATDFAHEGEWRWLNDRYFTSSFPWIKGEPNNHDGKQHCLNWGGVSYNGYQTFDDGNCDVLYQYVCEH